MGYRFEIQARFKDRKKMKFGPLFKNKRTFKTEKYAKGILSKQREYCPELELKIVPIYILSCALCGHELRKE